MLTWGLWIPPAFFLVVAWMSRSVMLVAPALLMMATYLYVWVRIFNLFGAKTSDVDYFYASRLAGEPPAGVDDIHIHPVEPFTVRVGLSTTF